MPGPIFPKVLDQNLREPRSQAKRAIRLDFSHNARHKNRMSLAHALSIARTEEDVKDAYVKAIGLKPYSKGQVDIQADNMWFEAKEAPTPAFAMFPQLLFYVRDARLKGQPFRPSSP